MAHIFYSDAIAQEISTNVSVRNKKADQSWSNSLGPIIKFMKWVGQYRVYRPMRWIPLSFLNGLGHLVGYFGLGSSHTIQRNTQAGLHALFPYLSYEKISKLTKASIKFMGQLLLDITFRLPLIVDNHIHRYVKFVNINKLYDALATGKGVIVPTLHIGEYFHSAGGIIEHPQHFTIATVLSLSNLPMYQMNNRKNLDNLYCYASGHFSRISKFLEHHLRQNNILIMYHDYSSPGQLRVPILHKELEFLINTPQSYISLQRATGAVILPCIAHPDGIFGKSSLEFLDNSEIMATANSYANESAREFHGRMSVALNRTLYPYVRKYAHMWEEIMRISTRRCVDRLDFPAECTILDFLNKTREKLISILDTSFEPDRDDQGIKNLLNTTWDQILLIISDKPFTDKPICKHRCYISLSLMSGYDEILKILQVTYNILHNVGEETSSQIVMAAINHILDTFLPSYQKVWQFTQTYTYFSEIYTNLTQEVKWKAKIWKFVVEFAKESMIIEKFISTKENIKQLLQYLLTLLNTNIYITEIELKNAIHQYFSSKIGQIYTLA